MQRKATKDEAAKFIAAFGAQAHEKALEAEREARKRQQRKRAEFMSKVARTIAKETE